MQDHAAEQELKDRVRLIETMMAQGRSTTESWGWTFVLWGIAYYVALAWSAWDHSQWAWLVVVAIAIIITVVVSSTRNAHHPATVLGRAIGAIWMSLGTTMFLLFSALGLSGRLTDPHVFIAAIAAFLGLANGASGLILRWKLQLACAGVWWAAAVLACFGPENQSLVAFLVAIFLCQIVFGIYSMIAKGRKPEGSGLLHA